MNKCTRYIPTLFQTNKRFISGPKRKYPIDPEHEKSLPVFNYTKSKEKYRRVFSWGNIYTGALGKPFKRYEETADNLKFLLYPKRISFGEKHEVTAATCGFGFTVFSILSDTSHKVFGTGINTDSQIGFHDVRKDHPLEVIFYPKPIELPFNNPQNSKVLKLAAGRSHTLILTNEGLFTLGNNAYGQCGRKIIENENYSLSNYVHFIKDIEDKQIVDIVCGQDHSLVLTADGSVYSCGWGADGQTGLGHFNNCSQFTKVKGDVENEKITKLACRSDFVLALNDKGDVFGWGNTEYGQMTLPNGDQQVSIPHHIEMLNKLGKITDIASAGAFCLAINDKGNVYSWGYGLLGVGPNAEISREPILIPETLFGKNDYQPDSTIVQVNCGLYHAAAVTNYGDLYIWGRNKNGCLGLGTLDDQYFPLKVAIGGYVEQIHCGLDHSIAICKPFI